MYKQPVQIHLKVAIKRKNTWLTIYFDALLRLLRHAGIQNIPSPHHHILSPDFAFEGDTFTSQI